MKKALLLSICCLLLCCGCQKTPKEYISDEASQVIVYVTRTGTKYHKSNCEYLKYSKKEITLQKAISYDYEPCSICVPPIIRE